MTALQDIIAYQVLSAPFPWMSCLIRSLATVQWTHHVLAHVQPDSTVPKEQKCQYRVQNTPLGQILVQECSMSVCLAPPVIGVMQVRVSRERAGST